MRTVRRPRRYVAGHWVTLFKPVLRYSHTRDAFVLRVIGSSVGPVLRVDRRAAERRPFGRVDRRRATA
jgi:hypothetical protein